MIDKPRNTFDLCALFHGCLHCQPNSSSAVVAAATCLAGLTGPCMAGAVKFFVFIAADGTLMLDDGRDSTVLVEELL